MGLLRDLERPSRLFHYATPNWYAAVMVTGIVAVAATALPYQFHGLRTAATVASAATATLLVGLTLLTALHRWLRPATARGHASNSAMARLSGAPPMAMLMVEAGLLFLGRDWIGPRAAIDVGWVCWFAGTATDLLSAAAVPYLMFARHEVRADSAVGWLMPVVPPMVSASTGAMLRDAWSGRIFLPQDAQPSRPGRCAAHEPPLAAGPAVG